MGAALTGTTLVEDDDAIALRVEELTHLRVGAAARPAVQEHHWLASRIATLFEVQLMDVRDAQEALVVRLERWVERGRTVL